MNLDFAASPELLTQYLKSAGWIKNNDAVIRLEKPGEGNMNMVIRIITEQTSLILKQSQPYVQKYPHVPAPRERVLVESEFYQLIQSLPIKERMPGFLGVHKTHYILALEDLGVSADYTFLYKKGQTLSADELGHLVSFLNELHHTQFTEKIVRAFPDNLALRRLNHEHLFHFPFMTENGFDLDTVQPGLQDIAMTYKTDVLLKEKLSELGNVYLGSGDFLLHGDYYPGSWLKVRSGLKVIDPEFCYFGRAEYDLGICIAHMMMARQPEDHITFIMGKYHATSNFNMQLMSQFTGMEILRRIIGLAQLPLELTLQEKKAMLKEAAVLVKGNHG